MSTLTALRGSTAPGRAAIRSEVRTIRWDVDDPWGSGSMAAFALGDVLVWELGEYVPAQLEYRPGPMRPTGDHAKAYAGMAAAVDDGRANAADVQYWAIVLARYLDLVQRAGRDY